MCGNGWDAMNDLLGEEDFPIILEVRNMEVLERRWPKEAAIFKALLKRKPLGLHCEICLIMVKKSLHFCHGYPVPKWYRQ